ncbi:MAG: class I SAM-dependent methyltransferase [Eubacteriaceae bacterium]|nr:class I SAM-dependent methyltransferase [Eubacteriaceae bacterium]
MESVWDKLSEKYDSLWVQKYSLSPTRYKVAEIISRLANSPSFGLLDLGCGTGQLISELSILFPESVFVGVDKSQSMLDIAKEKCPSVDFLLSEAENLEIGFVKMDFITCCHSFPYYQDKGKAADKIKLLVKPGGYAILVQASVNSLYDKIAMWFVEKTAEPAQYLEKNDFLRYFMNGFDLVEQFALKEKWYMPTIYGFVLRRGLDAGASG